MSLNFADVKGIILPQGNAKRLTDAGGRVLWEKEELDQYTKLLLKFDASGAMVDRAGHSVTLASGTVGAAETDADFGTVYPCSGAEFEIPFTSDLEFGGGRDFTVEWWEKRNSEKITLYWKQTTVSMRGFAFFDFNSSFFANKQYCLFDSTPSLRNGWDIGDIAINAGYDYLFGSGNSILNQWVHRALVGTVSGSATTLRAFENGTMVNSGTYNALITARSNATGSGSTLQLVITNGYIYKMMLSVGIARYTSDFTPVKDFY